LNPERLEHLGISLTRAQWARRLGISKQELCRRLASYPKAIALNPDHEVRKRLGYAARTAVYRYQGEELTVAQIMKREKVSRRTVYNWAEAGKVRRVFGPRRGQYT